MKFKTDLSHNNFAGVVELADTYGSEPYAARREGSNPSSGTKQNLVRDTRHKNYYY